MCSFLIILVGALSFAIGHASGLRDARKALLKELENHKKDLP